MTLVELYSKDDCTLCDEARAVLDQVRRQVPFKLREFKLMPGDSNYEEYKEMVPVVHINKVPEFKYRVGENLLKIKLQQHANEPGPPDVDPDEPSVEKD
jgi:hypothetical protein